MDANECTIARAGADIEVIWHKESHVARKQDSGGQSQRRFERGREMELIQWLKEVSYNISKIVATNDIILAGPAETKQKLLQYLTEPVRNRIVSIVDVGYTNEAGIYEAIERSKDDIKECKSIEDKRIGDEFARLLAKEPDLVDYGPDFDRTNVKQILVSEMDERYAGLPVRVIEHPVVRALGVCVIKKYKSI